MGFCTDDRSDLHKRNVPDNDPDHLAHRQPPMRHDEVGIMIGHHANRCLAFAGRNGPLILFVGVLAGLIAPRLAERARPLLGLAVFTFTLGAFLKVDLASFRKELERPGWMLSMLAWTSFGVPLVMMGLLSMFKLESGLVEGMMLCMLAPPVGSAAAIAAMLGLSAPLSLVMTVVATILSPLYLPAMASWFAGYHLDIDPVAMTLRLLVIVGGACLSAILLRRYAGRFVTNNPHAMTGIAVLGLILVALGAMRGMRGYLAANPSEVAYSLILAFAVNAGFQCLGALVFAGAGPVDALSVGLVSGNRNVTLVWAAAGSSLVGQHQVELYLAASVLPIFMLPALSRRVIAWLLRGAPTPFARSEILAVKTRAI
jgi:predicted Na+-dependent transporter